MRNRTLFHRILSLLLCLAMLCVLPVVAMAEEEPAWKKNELTYDLMGVFEDEDYFNRKGIVEVTFLDTLKDAPQSTWFVGRYANANVRAWFTWDNGWAHLYVAAEGGINLRYSCERMFQDCVNLKRINFNNAVHTDDVCSMREMFRDCRSLEELDLSCFNTENVKSMYCMFALCTNLEKVDLSSFDTSNVTNMGYMFSTCRKLESVDVDGFDTKNVWNMEGTFRWCDALKDCNAGGWDTSSVLWNTGFMDEGMTLNGQPWEKMFG